MDVYRAEEELSIENLESVGIKIGEWYFTPDGLGLLYNQYCFSRVNNEYIIRTNNLHPDHNRQYVKLGTFNTEEGVIKFLRKKGIIS